jgi:8-amino-7-oxononanoate synthase
MSSIPQRGDTILYDYLAHASLRDGIRLSNAESFSFRHNEVSDLENKLQKTKGNVFVATESLFSMDGDMAPLLQIVEVCERYGAHLIIDEAHATGIIGKKGEGLVQQLGLENRVFARVHTFGKAVGCHGAIVLGSPQLKSYLLNFARSFIFTTALPESAVTAIQASYTLFPAMVKEREHLQKLIALFNNTALPFEKLPGTTPIKAVIVPGNTQVKTIANRLQQLGLDIRPILYPTVPKEKERLRINLHAFNTIEQVREMLFSLTSCSETLFV